MKNLKVEEKKTWQIVFPESYVIEHFYAKSGVFFLLFPREDVKTPRCKYPCVSFGTTGSSLPSGIRCACPLLNPVPSINITCNETKLSPGNTACQCGGWGGGRGGAAPSAGLPVEALICTWSAHAESRTQRYTDKGRDTLAETAEKTQGNSSLAQKRSPPESLEIARREAPQLVRDTHPRPCFRFEKDGDVCPGWNVPGD